VIEQVVADVSTKEHDCVAYDAKFGVPAKVAFLKRYTLTGDVCLIDPATDKIFIVA
jgi:hypothetical protein